MKNIIIEIGKKFLCIFFVFPIKNNRIFFSAYSGRQYSCNPKYISDVLITDYSSSIWDFSLMEKPCFLFMPDYNEYIDEREFYTPIQDWPYPASFSMEDLEDKIIKYDHEIAKKRILNHHIKLGICESGMASEIVGKEIVKLCRYQ